MRELEQRGEKAQARVLEKFMRALQAAVRIKRIRYNRVLPLGDYLIDRWEKSKFLGFGEGTSVYDSCLILGSPLVGKHCWIGPFTILDASGGLTIGDHCTISAGAQLYSHDSVQRTVSGAAVEHSPLRLGDRVYVGPNVVIARGVTIGDNVVIGANSYVNIDIPSNSKAAGNPACIVGSLR